MSNGKGSFLSRTLGDAGGPIRIRCWIESLLKPKAIKASLDKELFDPLILCEVGCLLGQVNVSRSLSLISEPRPESGPSAVDAETDSLKHVGDPLERGVHAARFVYPLEGGLLANEKEFPGEDFVNESALTTMTPLLGFKWKYLKEYSGVNFLVDH